MKHPHTFIHNVRLLILLVLSLCGCYPLALQAQLNTNTNSPYELKWQQEVPILGGGIGLSALYLSLHKKKQPLTPAQINLLNVNDIPKIDRIATRYWSPPAQKASDVLLYASIAAPLFLLADKNMRQDIAPIAIMGIETFVVNMALTGITKELVQRKRPFTYNPDAPMYKKVDKDATSSFFSGHTSVTAAMSFYTAQVYADYYPNNKRGKSIMWASAATIPAVTAFLRVRGGKHFPTDVLVGYLVGAGVGILMPRLHRVKSN